MLVGDKQLNKEVAMKRKRQHQSEHQFKHRAGWTDEHHLKNRKNGGQSIKSNLIRLDAYRHDAIHLLFGDKSLREIIELLERLERIKNSQKRKFYL